jgi:hypothetical protein
MDAPASQRGLPVRPGETGSAPVMSPHQVVRSLPPTPRADAWRARMPERFNDWTIRQRAVYSKIRLAEILEHLRQRDKT